MANKLHVPRGFQHQVNAYLRTDCNLEEISLCEEESYYKNDMRSHFRWLANKPSDAVDKSPHTQP